MLFVAKLMKNNICYLKKVTTLHQYNIILCIILLIIKYIDNIKIFYLYINKFYKKNSDKINKSYINVEILLQTNLLKDPGLNAKKKK